MMTLETVPLDILSNQFGYAQEIHAGHPTHWLKCHLTGNPDATPQVRFDALHDAFLPFLQAVADECGPISTMFCYWPHCAEYPEIHAFLRIPNQDTPPIRTMHRIETPLVITTKTMNGLEHDLIAAYAANLWGSITDLREIQTYIEPLQRDVDWKI